MAEKQGIDWSSLWKKEEWLAVWIGFLIIILMLLGVKIKTPSFKWTTEGAFGSYLKESRPAVEKLIKSAQEKGETSLQPSLLELQKVMETGDRKAIGGAAKKLEEGAKTVKDEGLKKKSAKTAKEIRGSAGQLLGKVFSAENILWSIYLGIGYLILSVIAMAFMGEKAGLFIAGFPAVYILSWISLFLAGNSTINYYGLEYVLWCLFIGLFVSNVIGLPEWLKPAVKTEFYIKTGLVILGSGILFGEIVEAGAYGIVQAVLVVAVIWYFSYWLCRKLGIDEEFSAMLSSAVSICGVSAAIATSGAVKGDPKKLSYVTSIVLICAVPMLVLQPIIAKYFSMPDVVAGAWIGGTLDTSGSVVAAGALISEVAMKIGVIVKMSQNVLIGVAAFILSIVWTLKKAAEVPGGEKPSLMEIWFRFPKFVLGFIIASVVFSFFLGPETISAVKGPLGWLRTMWFALAFTCIGLETRFADLVEMGGGKPALAFVVAQSVNIIWTLILAYLIFGGYFFEPPRM
ncbi:MAG: putative sulfate exporter family transporter [Deltaproteobacteria bacterium]|nr:putative sulfate exporter family transporter [Deltaproteobacteria bacterium]